MAARHDPEPRPRQGIPAATVARLATYLGVLNQLASGGLGTISSGELAGAAGVNPAQLRKDLSYLGSYGVRGVGYDVDYLRTQLEQRIGSADQWPIIIVGVGHLGRALINHSGFSSRGFRVHAVFDADPELIGTEVDGHLVQDLSRLPEIIGDPKVVIGVIATPASAAQAVADELVAAGLRSLLNFAPCNLQVPAQITVRKVDLGSELQILAYHRQLSLADEITSGSPLPDSYARNS